MSEISTAKDLDRAYARIEEAKSRLDSLVYLMDDADPFDIPELKEKYRKARHLVDKAATVLLQAMDELRT